MVLNLLTNYGRRHSKQFTNCHVSWETLDVIFGVKGWGGVIIQENNIYPCAFMLEEIEVLFVPPTYIQLVMCKHLIGIQKFFFFF